MRWPTLIAIYFTLWWTVLFAVLPFFTRRPEQAGEAVEIGHDRGAPAAPRIWRIVIATTLVAFVIEASFDALFATGIVNWRVLVGADG
jgi:predicted secreted protein